MQALRAVTCSEDTVGYSDMATGLVHRTARKYSNATDRERLHQTAADS